MLNVFSMVNGNKTCNSLIGLQCQFVVLTENLIDCAGAVRVNTGPWGRSAVGEREGQGPS